MKCMKSKLLRKDWDFISPPEMINYREKPTSVHALRFYMRTYFDPFKLTCASLFKVLYCRL